MHFELIPAAYMEQELVQKLTAASSDIENEWFFFDGTFQVSSNIGLSVNSWLHENFVVVCNNEIIAYFEGYWERPRDVINSFRCINFSKNHSILATKALFKYFDYLFVNRGCKVLNWVVALQNKHAIKQYDRFINHYCGHCVGILHHSQKSYTGKISDSCLYAITQEEYFQWKLCGNKKSNKTVSIIE